MVVSSRNFRAWGVISAGMARLLSLSCDVNGEGFGPQRRKLRALLRVFPPVGRGHKKTPAGRTRPGLFGGFVRKRASAGEDAIELFLDLHFFGLRGHGDLL